jgi:hypothetical protein
MLTSWVGLHIVYEFLLETYQLLNCFLQEFPGVKQLQVHLENEQSVTSCSEGLHSLNSVHPISHDTQLTGFFKENQKKNLKAQQLYYIDFLTKFVWTTELHKWLPQKKVTVYGHMMYIPPNASENSVHVWSWPLQRICSLLRIYECLKGSSTLQFTKLA